MIKKNSLCLLSIFFSFFLAATETSSVKKPIKLQNTLITWLDGVKGAIDDISIKNMVDIYGNVRRMQHGIKNPQTGKLEGKFVIDGHRYTLRDLARIEHDIDQEYAQKKEEIYKKHIVQRTAFDADLSHQVANLEREYFSALEKREDMIKRSYRVMSSSEAEQLQEDLLLRLELGKMRRTLEHEHRLSVEHVRIKIIMQHVKDKATLDKEIYRLDEERKSKLAPYQETFREAKEEFKRINAPYLESVQGTKAIMEMLIEESCQARGRTDSFLLEWSIVPEGQEMESFEKNITTFRSFDVFCTDLTNFLQDVIVSCPKACAQAGLNIKL
jgi:hypothetical protein